MKSNREKLYRPRLGDLLAAAAVLLLAGLTALALLRPVTGRLTARVYANGELVRAVEISSLSQPFTYKVNDLLVRFERGRACILSADCPDKLCVKTGWLTRPGTSAICLPNRVVLTLSGDGGVDVTVQ